MSLKVILITIIIAIIFVDVIAIMPSMVVRIIAFIGNLNTKTLAIFLLLIAIVLIAVKKVRK